MGCLMSPRMDSENEDEQEVAGHAPATLGATPPTSPVRRKPTHHPPPLPSTLSLVLKSVSRALDLFVKHACFYMLL